jgi:hypothetical protein
VVVRATAKTKNQKKGKKKNKKNPSLCSIVR